MNWRNLINSLDSKFDEHECMHDKLSSYKALRLFPHINNKNGECSAKHSLHLKLFEKYAKCFRDIPKIFKTLETKAN